MSKSEPATQSAAKPPCRARRPPCPCAPACCQTGYTLPELAVGAALGMLCTLAALAGLSTTQSSAQTLSDSQQLQHTADELLHNIGRQVQQAGAIRLEGGDTSGPIRFSPPRAGQAPLAGSGNAVLQVQFAAQPALRDCLGQTARSATTGSRFELYSGQLRCLGEGGPNALGLARGVEGFALRYGVAVQGPQDRADTRLQFLPAAEVTDWHAVRAVAVCLELASGSGGHPPPPANQLGCNGQALGADGYLRRTFRRSFVLRNTLP